MDTISALHPEKPPLGVWYLVTAGGLSSVKITDGLTFAEEDAHEGKQLALVPRCAEEGLIRFRVDASGIWLSVCHGKWQISGAEGIVVRPFPIFKPVDLYFRDSVVHLRPDFMSLDSEQTIDLRLERLQPTLSQESILELQHQINVSGPNAPVRAPRRTTGEALAVVSPLPKPGFRQIGGQGRPSSVRLIPDPATRNEIPLLTDTVDLVERPSVRQASAEIEAISLEEELIMAEPLALPDEVVEAVPEESVSDAPIAAPAASPKPPKPQASPKNQVAPKKPATAKKQAPAQGQKKRPKVPHGSPKRRILARLMAVTIGLILVSVDLSGVIRLIESGFEAPTSAAVMSISPELAPSGTPAVPPQSPPSGQPDSTGQLMAAVQALLESKDPSDPVTRQFVEDAIRVVNDGASAVEERPEATTPEPSEGAPGTTTERPSDRPE